MDEELTGDINIDRVCQYGTDDDPRQGLRPGEVYAWSSPPPSSYQRLRTIYGVHPNPYSLGMEAFDAYEAHLRYHEATKRKRHRSIDDPWENSSEGS